jgi:excisionase family DNA binding protein
MVKSDPSWISMRDAAKLLACSRRTVSRLLAEGRIGVKQIPGTPPRLSRGDCQAILKASHRPALVAPALELQEANHAG